MGSTNVSPLAVVAEGPVCIFYVGTVASMVKCASVLGLPSMLAAARQTALSLDMYRFSTLVSFHYLLGVRR